MSNLVEKWQGLLNVGNAVIDEQNAATCLENFHEYIKNNLNKFPDKFSVIFVPMIRKLLTFHKLNFNPDLKDENNKFSLKSSLDLMTSFPELNINEVTEMTEVIFQEFKNHLSKYQKWDVINFNITYDKDIEVNLNKITLYVSQG